MSTFNGFVKEFPDIRIDYFRQSANPDEPPPRACFLSHIHSDHIQGLEGAYNAPFIYCSAATKELLVRLERRVHRLNWQKQIVESHDCKYREKKRLLKVIPLETPTWVEIDHDKRIRVTLFDANHCVGAVMFLIEEDKPDGKAILYTGDIRAEDWWVENLKRHPVLAPYTSGIKKLDKIYLDTSWGWRGYEKFASKRDGLNELLAKMIKYPSDTKFHLNTWTFGYEELWVALAAAFNSQIHLTPYHYRLFKSVPKAEQWVHGPFLCGFELGNSLQPGVITTNPDVRIHSCERGLHCPGLQQGNVVYITPIVARIEGIELAEDGINFGDLTNNDDFSLHGQLNILLDVLGPTIKPDIRKLLVDASKSRKESVPMPTVHGGNEDVTLTDLLSMFADVAKERAVQRKDTQGDGIWPGTEPIRTTTGEELPTWIKFPYSRHSSLGELRNLVSAFRPRDVHPCVVDDVTWTERNSIASLYGDLCSGTVFAHDEQMKVLHRVRQQEQELWEKRIETMAEESQMRCDLHHPGPETQRLDDLEDRIRRSITEQTEPTPPDAPTDPTHPPLMSSPPLPDEYVLPELVSPRKGLRSFEMTSSSGALERTASLQRDAEARNQLFQELEVGSSDPPPSSSDQARSPLKKETPSRRAENSMQHQNSLKRISRGSTDSPVNSSTFKKLRMSPIPMLSSDDDIFTPLGVNAARISAISKATSHDNVTPGGVRRMIGSANRESGYPGDILTSSHTLRRSSADDNTTKSSSSRTDGDMFTSSDKGSSKHLSASPTKRSTLPPSNNPLPSSNAISNTFRHTPTSIPTAKLPSPSTPFPKPPLPPPAKLTPMDATPQSSTQPTATPRSTPTNNIHRHCNPLPGTNELISRICSEAGDLDPWMVAEAAKAALGLDRRSWWDVGLVSCEESVEYVLDQEL